MWRQRSKRGGALPRQLALGRLEDALGRVDQARRRPDEPDTGEPAGPAPAAKAPAASAGNIPAQRTVRKSARRPLSFFFRSSGHGPRQDNEHLTSL
jgi:hypothetical protein